MKRSWIVKVLTVVSLIWSCGCAAMFIPATNNPYKKLYWAEQLFDKQDRPLPAERLIREAMSLFNERNDKQGIAMSYRLYGFFLKSTSIKNWETFYRKNGFLDKSVTYDKRLEKAVEYFKKAEELFLILKEYDAITNISLNLGYTYEQIGDLKKASDLFDQSLEAHRENLRQNPETKVNLPIGYNSYEEFIISEKKRLKTKM
jgi:tetratricopeptide (TPR) repeat protein